MGLNGICSVVCGGESWHQNSTKSSNLLFRNLKNCVQKELADLTLDQKIYSTIDLKL